MHWAGYKKAWESAQLWIQRSDFWAAEDARFCMSGNKGGGRCAKGGPENIAGQHYEHLAVWNGKFERSKYEISVINQNVRSMK